MKLITAIVRPHVLDNLRVALSDIGLSGMTVTEVSGYGRQKGHKEIYRGAEYEVTFLPKIKIEIAMDDELVEPTVATISEVAKTGKFGDGKIFVIDLLDAVRVRTGEAGPAAL